MSQQTNDKSGIGISKKRLTALILPVLGVCWLAFLLFPGYLGEESTIDYAAMTLGAGLMVAGVFRFLYSPDDESSDEAESESGESADRNDGTDSATSDE